MSLRYQVNIRILIISFCILIMGGSIAIWQARNAVFEEVDSSINLALQLIRLGFSSIPTHDMDETEWVYRLSVLEQTRHLNITLKKPTGQLVKITNKTQSDEQDELPPAWFIHLMDSDYPVVEHQITSFDNKPYTLIIEANPLDEMTEAWQETLAFFAIVFLLTLLTFLAVHLVFNKTLKSIDTIVNRLKRIETGEYKQKLPDFNTKEYNSIAKAINHMLDVLDTTQQQNTALTEHSLQIQEDERQRLSQELHDEFGQSLTAIKVMAVTAGHEKSDTAKITESISDICDHLMTVVRTMMQQLHPLILTELGLKATLEDLVNLWKERHPELLLTLNCDENIDTLDKKITIQVYRVIQECLTNIIRHASAQHVSIELDLETHQVNKLFFQVKDDGQGCDIDSVASGFGLLGMRERVRSLDGRFEMASVPGAGMTVSGVIPVT